MIELAVLTCVEAHKTAFRILENKTLPDSIRKELVREVHAATSPACFKLDRKYAPKERIALLWRQQ